jgi:CheY-like chemotaxis protein/HPt (histidine-containing phosphotransfer) domain-containing protein
VVKASAQSLLAIIDQILDFSKIEAGKLDLVETEFELDLTIEDVVETFAHRAQSKGLELGCHIEPLLRGTMRGDADRLRQILVNLINNAIKFTQKGEVVIRAGIDGETSAGKTTVRVSVTDSGIGVPADRLNRLFKSFSQGDASTTRKYGGTGLGLAISKQLAELMGGQIGVSSVPGEGSTFWFTAALTRTASRRSATSATETTARSEMRPSVDPRGLRVLVVDDNAAHRDVIRAQLASWGLDADVAPTAVRAEQTLLTAFATGKPFSVVILDSVLPDASAQEFAKRIRSSSKLRDTVLMILTTLETSVDPAALASAGFAGHINKPVRQSALYDTIMRAIACANANACYLSDGKAGIATTHLSKEAAAASKGARILLAEDNEVNQMVADEILTTTGYRCRIVPDGKQALEAATSDTDGCDLVLMDCQMPEMDGFEASRQIRLREAQRGAARHVPIIALTANALKGDRERCLEAGMDDYISKPLDPAKLVAAIERHLKNAPKVVVETRANTPSAPALPAISQPVSLPPIDPAALLERCMGNVAFVEKILEKFREQSLQTIEQLVKDVASGNAEAASRVAHSLKGTAANLSAVPLQNAAARIERFARADDLESARQEIDLVRNELDRCLQYLPKALAEVADK